MMNFKTLEFVVDNRIIEITEDENLVGFIYMDEEGFWFDSQEQILSADGLEEIADKLYSLDGILTKEPN